MRAVAIIVLVAAVVIAVLYFGEFVDFGQVETAGTVGENIEKTATEAAKETENAVNDAAKEVEKATD